MQWLIHVKISVCDNHRDYAQYIHSHFLSYHQINSLASGRCDSYFKIVISKHMIRIKFMSTWVTLLSHVMPQNTVDEKSTFVLVMAWCRQATYLYLNLSWARSLSPYGVTWPQWVNILTHWGRVTHICVGNQTIIGSDNGLSPGRRQAII